MSFFEICDKMAASPMEEKTFEDFHLILTKCHSDISQILPFFGKMSW